MRFNLIQSIIFSLLGLIVGGLFYMQIIRGDGYHHLSMNNHIRVVESVPPRGMILDRHGVVLADSRLTFNVGVVPGDIEDKKVLLGYVAGLLHQDPAFLQRQYDHKKISPFAPVILAADVPREVAVKIEEEKFLYPGLCVVQGFERFYPFGETGAHVLGLVGKSDESHRTDMDLYGYTPLTITGKTGIEKEYDALLQGQAGGRQIEVDSRGEQVRLLGTREPIAGRDLVLTIDQRIQKTAAELLKGSRGSIIVMDLDHADVLALVNSPSYDPNVFSDKNKRDILGRYLTDPAAPLLNRAISGRYPPGSVFKVVVATAALENHFITSATTFDCLGFMMVGKRRFGCSHVHGTQDLISALAHSCNVYFFHVGERVGAALIGAYARAFGLSRTTGIDLPFESKGQLVTQAPMAGGWYTGDTLNLSIGQGSTLATPLQMTVLMAAVANEGVILFPRLVKRESSLKGVIRLRPETWHKLQEGLKSVVDDPQGTGHVLKDIQGMDIYGKTGTAQSVHGKPNHAWFVGWAQSPKQRIVFCVFLEYGGSSENAVLIAKNLLLSLQKYDTI